MSALSLVSVQKPTTNNPILQRRNKFAASIDQQINKIQLFREAKRVSKTQFWIESNGTIYFQLKYAKHPLEMKKGMSTLKAATFDDLVAQLDEVKAVAVAGGLDEALTACATAVRANFKAAKDKKTSGK